jgi:hypothetical protein
MTTIEKPSTPVEPAHGEVVTEARHRLVHLHPPGYPTGVTVSLITLDNGRNQRRPNTFGPAGLISLDTAIDTAIAAQPDAIAIIGKPGSFAAGADLSQLVGSDRSAPEDFAALGRTRTQVMAELRTVGVNTQVLYIPVHLQPWYRRTFGYAVGKCPVAETFYGRALSLPLYPAMTDADVEQVIAAVHSLVPAMAAVA